MFNLTESQSPPIGDGPEATLAKGMAIAAVVLGPILVALSYYLWGNNGLYSSLYALLLVVINFIVAARALVWGGRISPVALMAAAMGSFFFDLLLLTVAVIPVATASWMSLKALGMTLIAAHVAAVSWEARRVTAYMAYSGIKPKSGRE